MGIAAGSEGGLNALAAGRSTEAEIDRILEGPFRQTILPVRPSDWNHAMRMQLNNGSSHHHQQPTYKKQT
jgi:hypothetical protein